MTNLDVITTALRLLGVIDAHQTPTAADAQIALQELNDLMTDLEADGISLSYPPQTDTSDDWPLNDSDAAQIKPLLAMRLFDFFPSQKIPDTLPGRASTALERLLRDAVLANREETSVSHIPLGTAGGPSNSILTDD